MSRIVLPSSRSERTVSQAARRASGSKPVVGSSRKISSGSPTSASAKSSRRSCPPESLRLRTSACRLQAGEREHLLDVARMRIEARPVRERLARRDVAVDAARLQHDADAPAQLDRALGRVVAEHRHLAAAARAVALEDLHRRGLAGAVGAEQPEHLAAAHRDVDAAHRLVVAVALAQGAVPRSRGRRRRSLLRSSQDCAQPGCSTSARPSSASPSRSARRRHAPRGRVWPFDAAESGNTR